MSTTPTCLYTNESLTVLKNGKPYTVTKAMPTWTQAVEAYKKGDWQKLLELIEVKTAVISFLRKPFEFNKITEEITINGEAVPDVLQQRLLSFMKDNLPIEPLLRFVENLFKNPSNRAVNELYRFLEYNNMPITPDGCFIAYKKVKSNLTDNHTGSFDNTPGKIVSVPRNRVDEDSNRTCSHGLHVASYEYAKNFLSGGILLLVKVNPKDVVAVPQDYNNAKMRVCEYLSVEVAERNLTGESLYGREDSIMTTTDSTTSASFGDDCDDDGFAY